MGITVLHGWVSHHQRTDYVLRLTILGLAGVVHTLTGLKDGLSTLLEAHVKQPEDVSGGRGIEE